MMLQYYTLNFLIPQQYKGFPGSSDDKKHLPAMQETWVQSLGWEDPLEKEMATHSSVLDWKIPWMQEPGKIGRAHV